MSETPKAPTVVLIFNPATNTYAVLSDGKVVKASRDPAQALVLLRKESSK